jgi:hypothetical protein
MQHYDTCVTGRDTGRSEQHQKKKERQTATDTSHSYLVLSPTPRTSDKNHDAGAFYAIASLPCIAKKDFQCYESVCSRG